MSETSNSYTQATLWDTVTSTSSVASAGSLLDSSGQTFRNLSESLPVVSPVRISVMPDNEQALQENGLDSGKKCTVSFRKRLIAAWHSITSSWRTSQLSLTGDYQLYSETWPKQGMMQSGSAYELQTLEHHIDVSGSLLWPTPTVIDSGSGRVNRSDSPNAAIRPTLAMIARKGLWSTPAAQDSKNSTLPPSQVTRDTLPGDLMRHGLKGQLNPSWVECLMGYPEGWTDIAGLLALEKNSENGSQHELSQDNQNIA